MSRHFEKSKSTPARRNSSANNGMSKRLELKPAKSQPVNLFASSAAFSLNVGAAATSSLVMPVSSSTSCGISFSGLMKRFSLSSFPSGNTFIYDNCMMRSFTRSSPVVSKSKTIKGFVKFSNILLLFIMCVGRLLLKICPHI